MIILKNEFQTCINKRTSHSYSTMHIVCSACVMGEKRKREKELANLRVVIL